MNRTSYHKFWYYLLIPVVGLALAVMFTGEHSENGERMSQLTYILHGIFISTGLWIGCMIIVMYLWNKFPWEQKPVKHLLLEIFLILMYTNLFSYALYKVELHFKLVDESDNLFLEVIITNLITILITAIHEAAEFYKQWKYNFSKSVRLERDSIEAKYEMLKTQVNPHFLFNSLNSLTSIVEENEEAVNYISNLSDFLRYMLKSKDKQVVLLREEITILKQYIELQKSRFKENLVFHIDVDEKFYHFSTPPLVVQMLVENCIKHNIISKSDPLQITIRANKNWLSVENNLQPKNSGESTGQGLKNISERYSYFTTDQVRINQTNGTFKVTIPLLQVEL